MTAKKRLMRNIIISVAVIALLGVSYVFVLDWDVERNEPQTKEITYVISENVEDISSVHIKNQRAEYDIVLQENSKGDITYSIPYLKEMETNSLQIENALISILQMAAVDIVSEDEGELSEFGLEIPECSYTVHRKDGNELTVLIGGETPMGGEFYCAVQGGETIYVIGSYAVSAVMAMPDDYCVTSIIKLNSVTDITDFSLKKDGVTIMSVSALSADEQQPESMISSAWKMTYPWQEDVDSEKFAELLSKLVTIESKAFGDDAAETVFDYEIKLSTDENDYSFSIGGTAPDGGVYLKNGKYVYVIDSAIGQTVENVNPDDYVVKFVNLAYIDAVTGVSVRCRNAEFTMEPSEGEGKPYIIDGEEVNESEFKKLYQMLVGMLYTQHTDTTPDGEPYLKVIYNYKDGTCDEISFYEYDERNMLAVRPNGTTVTVLGSEVEKITEILADVATK